MGQNLANELQLGENTEFGGIHIIALDPVSISSLRRWSKCFMYVSYTNVRAGIACLLGLLCVDTGQARSSDRPLIRAQTLPGALHPEACLGDFRHVICSVAS